VSALEVDVAYAWRVRDAYAEHLAFWGRFALHFETWKALGGADRAAAEWEPERIVGDPALGADGDRIAVDAVCPHCGWPERSYSTLTRRFGCVVCEYTSDERDG